MMGTTPTVAILVGLLALGLLVTAIVVKRRHRATFAPDYRALFIMGAVWIPAGMAVENPGLWGMGLVFLLVGLANRGKWSERKAWSALSPVERRIKLLLLIGLVLLLVLSVAFGWWRRSTA
jgi:hypothetical protein